MKSRIYLLQILLLSTVYTLISCTNYHEEDAPDGISINASELSFPTDGGSRSLTVRSGSKWSVVSSPEWVSVKSINPSVNAFEWVVDFSATSNNEYNREGVIVLTARSETVKIQAIQEGKKGQYFAVESVSLSENELTLTVGDSFPMSYEINPSNASIKDVSWESSSPSVATVSNTGRIDAIAEGTSIITVTTNDGSKKATCNVTVKPVSVSSVSLDRESLSLIIGETTSLTSTVYPENAANKNVSWSSSNNDVAIVDSNGQITAIGIGKATITVTTEDGGKTATCAVSVNPISVTGVELNKSSLSLTLGLEERLVATISPEDATNKNVTWKSSNSNVVTVDSNGNISAIKVGTATITVITEDGGKTASCTVTVTPIAVTSISLDQTSLSMTEGETYTLAATVSPSNATDKTVTWSSSNSSVASVSSSGVVTAIKAGTTTITARAGSKTATCSIIVKAPTIPVTSITLNKSSLSLTVGDTEYLSASILPSNATDKSLFWSSDDTEVATVSNLGLVTAIAPGSATITVTTCDGNKKASCAVTVQAQTIAVTGVSLDKTSLSMTVGDTQTLTATITPSNATNKAVTWTSSNMSIATVSSSGVVTAKAAGTAAITVTTNDGGKTAACTITVTPAQQTIDGHEYVEMGDGLKWATMNVGAMRPEEYGDYFAWGETLPKSNYDWSNYKYGTSSTSLTKYVTYSDYGSVDNKTVLESSDDAATVNWGGSWRMPTIADWMWLMRNCTWSWTANYNNTGIAGHIVTSNVSGYKGHSIFFPAAGYCDWGIPDKTGTLGCYWSSTININDPYLAYDVRFDSSDVYRYNYYRYYGETVRPVYGVSSAFIAVTGVKLNINSLSLAVGDTRKLTETVSPSNATDKSVIWSSSNLSIATVSSSGVVTAKAAGSATITVTTCDGNKKASCAVTVQAQTIAVTGVSLDKTSLSMTVGDTQTLTATITPSNATNKAVSWSSSNTSIATVSSSGVVTAKAAGSATITVTTNDGGKTDSCTIMVLDTNSGPRAIDLGLSVLWAEYNLGANSPSGQGYLLAWGEVISKSDYTWDNYQWAKGADNSLTKYCNDVEYGYMGFKDDLDCLLLEDDAAHYKYGNGWRIPTEEEWRELYDSNKCTWTPSVYSNISGYTIKSKINDNSIFIPYISLRSLPRSYYWTSCLGSNPSIALIFGFYKNDFYGYLHFFSGSRKDCFPIRPVKDK